MPQGDTLTISDPATPVEVVFRLRYSKGEVERLPNPQDYAAVTFGAMGVGPAGSTVHQAGPDLVTPALVRVQEDDQAVSATFRIGQGGFDATVNRQLMLYCQYCRADGSPGSPEGERIVLGYVRWTGPAPAPGA